MATAISNSDLRKLQLIEMNGGVRAPGDDKYASYARDSRGKIFPRVALESLVTRGYLALKKPPSGNQWVLTNKGSRAISDAVSAASVAKAAKAAKSTPVSEQKLDKDIAAFLDWKTAVRSIMKTSYFDEEEAYGQGENELLFATRENGEVGDERPGRSDILAAKELRDRVQREVPGVKGMVGTVDEWTNLSFKK